jgi:uncharacterized protein (DUF302 family)
VAGSKEEKMRTSVSYGYTKNLGKIEFAEAERRVTEALKSEGFGILTTIDVKATLKQKLGVDVRPYKILGACNPPLAHRALESEPMIGLLLPCNVVVFEDERHELAVSIAKPLEMFKTVDNPALEPLAREVDAKLQRALERV